MGASGSGRDVSDFWTDILTDSSLEHDAHRSRLVFEQIPSVVPINRKRPLLEQGNVPEALIQPIFSPHVVDENSQDAEETPDNQISAFAVVDGTRVPNLPELIDAHGIDAISLFGEDADERMIVGGPWLIRLDLNTRFVRNLFFEDPEQQNSNALWMSNWGVIIRSHEDIDGLARHLRRFTKVRDEHDQWFYFRFWDGDFMGLYLRQVNASELPLVTRLFAADVVESLIFTNPFDGVYSVRLKMPDGPASIAKPRIGFRREDFDAVGVELSDRRAARAYDESYGRIDSAKDLDELRHRISIARAACSGHGITEEGLPGTFILLGTVFNRSFWDTEAFMAYWSTATIPPDKRFRTYLSALKDQMIRTKLPVKPWW